MSTPRVTTYMSVRVGSSVAGASVIDEGLSIPIPATSIDCTRAPVLVTSTIFVKLRSERNSVSRVGL